MPVIKMKEYAIHKTTYATLHYDIPENVIHIPTEISYLKFFITQC